jgi:hypothetical protein
MAQSWLHVAAAVFRNVVERTSVLRTGLFAHRFGSRKRYRVLPKLRLVVVIMNPVSTQCFTLAVLHGHQPPNYQEPAEAPRHKTKFVILNEANGPRVYFFPECHPERSAATALFASSRS